jgi:hypothetical protein
MAEFKKLSEVEQIESASDNATVLIEEGGEIKRVPKKEVGGGGAIKTVIIKSSDYDNAVAGVATMATAAPAATLECINMTFDEAHQAMKNGEPLNFIAMVVNGAPVYLTVGIMGLADADFGTPCIVFEISGLTTLFWTADGLSTEQPGGEK